MTSRGKGGASREKLKEDKAFIVRRFLDANWDAGVPGLRVEPGGISTPREPPRSGGALGRSRMAPGGRQRFGDRRSTRTSSTCSRPSVPRRRPCSACTTLRPAGSPRCRWYTGQGRGVGTGWRADGRASRRENLPLIVAAECASIECSLLVDGMVRSNQHGSSGTAGR